MKEKPFLLLSNDDGFAAKGIQELIKVLRPMADLMVVAPSGPRSGLPVLLLQSIRFVVKR